MRAQHGTITVLGDIQHTQGTSVGADAELAAVQGDVDLRDTAFVLGLQEKVGEVQGPQTQLVVFRPSYRITEGIADNCKMESS